jgi:phosphoribosyl 1,2-cyclic phosphodiesterase
MEITVIASGSSGNAYRISDGTTALLLDAGIPIKEIHKALNFRVHDLAGCLITHEHGDHVKAASDLAKAGINIYASPGTIQAAGLSGHRIKAVQALKEFRIGSFAILPFDVQHDAKEPLGYLITSAATGEKLLYFTDSFYLKYRFDGLTHIMGECNYAVDIVENNIRNGLIPAELAVRLMKSHLSLEHFLGFLRSNDLRQIKQIYLLHLSDNNSDAERFKREVQRMTGVEVYVG